MHCALAIIGGHFLDAEKSDKLVLVSEIRLAMLIGIDSSTSFIKEHF